MVTRKELRNLIYLQQELDQIKNRIENYKPAEIVADSVRGSSASFPYTEHSILIEGLEQREDKLTNYLKRMNEIKSKLETEKRRIEEEIATIPFAEIRLIIRYHYIDRLTYVQIMHKMNYNAPETPRRKLERYLGRRL